MIIHIPKDRNKMLEISRQADIFQEQQRIKGIVLDCLYDVYEIYEKSESVPLANLQEELNCALDAVRISINIFNSIR